MNSDRILVAVFNSTWGVEDNANSGSISVFPNPTYDLLNIKGEGLINGNYDIILTDVLGNQLDIKSLKVVDHTILTTIDFRNLVVGQYLLKIQSIKISKIFKVQKQ